MIERVYIIEDLSETILFNACFESIDDAERFLAEKFGPGFDRREYVIRRTNR